MSFSYIATGTSCYRLPQFQWAPSRNIHDPNPPIIIESAATVQSLTFTAVSELWKVGTASLSPGAVSLTFSAPSEIWRVGSSSLLSPQDDILDLTFIAAGLRITVGDSVLTGPMVLTFSAAGLLWKAGRVKLRLPTEGYPLFGTSHLKSSLYGTG